MGSDRNGEGRQSFACGEYGTLTSLEISCITFNGQLYEAFLTAKGEVAARNNASRIGFEQ